MTNDEFDTLMDRVRGLYPGRMNNEQESMWRIKVIGLNAHDADRALDEYFVEPRRPADGPSPSLGAFLRVFRRIRDDGDSDTYEGEQNKPSRWEIVRRQWLIEAKGPGRKAIESMSDNEIALAWYKADFSDAVRLHGSDSVHAQIGFDRWQREIVRQGYEAMDYDPRAWDHLRPAAQRDPDRAESIGETVQMLRLRAAQARSAEATRDHNTSPVSALLPAPPSIETKSVEEVSA